MPSYTYEPLRKGHVRRRQCIRLVTLLPSIKDEKIRIHISRVSVEWHSYSIYEALSYTWGDPSNTSEIEVVPEPRGIFHRSKPQQQPFEPTTFQITANLAAALLHLRQQAAARVLWIDAICLDQKNNAEKSSEIWKMGEIYTKAKNVIVWLGSGSITTEQAFRAMSHLGRQVQWVGRKNQLLPTKDCDEEWKNWEDASFVIPFNQKTWLSIEEVISSDWFRRVWIWQEICLGNYNTAIVQCGASSLPWKTFLNAIAFFNIVLDSGAIGYQERFQNSLKPVANIALIPSNRHLLGLLGVTRRCGCTNPSDRIYGLLGLATQADLPEDKLLACLEPDYDKTASQVYKDFATGEIQIMRRLSILWHCDAIAWRDELPSWVPDWKTPLPYQNLNLGIFGGGRGALGPKDTFGVISDNILKVKGAICDTVQSCSAVASESIFELTSILRSWCKTTFSANKPANEETMDAICYAVTGGFIGKRYPEVLMPISLRAAKDIINHIVASTQPIESVSDIPLPEEASMFYHMRNAFPGRKLFITTTGCIGLAPSKTQPGDSVVSVIGSKRLLMLRSAPSDSSRIVGFCYLHGFMDLEALLGPLPEGYSVQLVGTCNDPWDMRFVRDGESSLQDPRLGTRLEGWRSDRNEKDGSVIWDHITSRIATKSDPRHTDITFLKKKRGCY